MTCTSSARDAFLNARGAKKPYAVFVILIVAPVARVQLTADCKLWAGGHFQSFYCAFSRSCLDQALRGEYNYLEGLVYAYACDHQRGIFNIWNRNKPGLYAEFIDMPSRVDLPEAKDFYTQELRKFQASLQKTFKVTITNEALWEAIEKRQISLFHPQI